MNMVLDEVFGVLHELFKEKKIPATIFGVAMALERNKRNLR